MDDDVQYLGTKFAAQDSQDDDNADVQLLVTGMSPLSSPVDHAAHAPHP